MAATFTPRKMTDDEIAASKLIPRVLARYVKVGDVIWDNHTELVRKVRAIDITDDGTFITNVRFTFADRRKPSDYDGAQKIHILPA